MYKVDLNSDLGESFGAYTIGLDKEVIAHISSANVACGYYLPQRKQGLLSAPIRAIRISSDSDAEILHALRRMQRHMSSISWEL